MAGPPDVAALAAAGLAALDVPGQALAVWERETLRVELTAVVDGRVGAAVARDASDPARAAKQATLRARQMRALPAPPLPPATTIDVPAADPGEAEDVVLDGVRVRTVPGVARVAIASSTGVHSVEARAWRAVAASAEATDGRAATVRAWSAVGPAHGAGVPAGGADAAGDAAASGDTGRGEPAGGAGPAREAALTAEAASEVRALLGVGPVPGPLVAAVPAVRGAIAAVAPRAVLGPEAVAVVLDAVRSWFGVDVALGAVALGARVAAAGVDLDDDAAHPLTLPRAFDVEGTARRPVPLVRDGILVGAVLDAAAAVRSSAASTGHASRALTLAPAAEHLVLGGGDAADVAGLCEAIGSGVYLPALVRAEDGFAAPGASAVEGGRPVAALVGLRVAIDARAVLGAVVGLTAARRVVALRGHAPGGPGAAVVPALATTDGVRVEHVDRP